MLNHPGPYNFGPKSCDNSNFYNICPYDPVKGI